MKQKFGLLHWEDNGKKVVKLVLAIAIRMEMVKLVGKSYFLPPRKQRLKKMSSKALILL